MSTLTDARPSVPANHRELAAETAGGAAMVTDATAFAERFAAGALAHDRDGSFAVEHLEDLRQAGFLYAPLPTDLGGAGVGSTHDVLVAMSRLARGDAATTIGVNMHFAVLLNIVRTWQVADARGDQRRARAVADRLQLAAAAGVVFASAVSEPAPQDLTRPSTTAVRNGEGWVVNGRKVFATMAPAATILNVAVAYRDAAGQERYGFALVPSGAAGVVFGDWDALGMRASASGSVTFEDVRIAGDALRDGFPLGEYSVALIERFLTSGAFHAAASLGIAEAAHAHILGTLRGRAAAAVADPHAVVRLAENVVDLSAMQASFDRAGRCIDTYLDQHPTGEASFEETQAVYGEVQASKAFVTAAAVRVVDRALALSGGAGYLANHPLAKAWRDVRAGGFMHPLGANRSDSYLARRALGLPPE